MEKLRGIWKKDKSKPTKLVKAGAANFHILLLNRIRSWGNKNGTIFECTKNVRLFKNDKSSEISSNSYQHEMLH